MCHKVFFSTMNVFIYSLLLVLVFKNSEAFLRKSIFPSTFAANRIIADPGEPLFLTPYIKSGKIELARNLSKVGPLPNAPNIRSHSGLLTVNDKYNSNMFFWFFPSLVSVDVILLHFYQANHK